MGRKLEYIINSRFDGKTVSDFLRLNLAFSSRIIKRLKRCDNGILLNGVHARTVDIVKEGDALEINIPSDGSPAAAGDVSAPVIYDDDDIIAFDKPAFMPVHPTRNHQGDTLGNAYASFMLKENRCCDAFRPVNRLDRDTTGIVVCGVNPYAASVLNGKIDKKYFAIACGVLYGEGTIDAPIYRPDQRRITRAVGENGARAVTHWRALESNGEFTLLEVTLETGRTHQIRVHFSYIGHPLAGDTMYGTKDDRIMRQALHCGEVSFIHPVNKKSIIIKSCIPDDMLCLLNKST